MSSLLERSSLRFLPATLALLFGLSGIAIGFYADDHALLAFLEQKVPHAPPPWDLYRFSPNDPAIASELRALGVLPWWTTPEWGLHLFRPVSSLLLALDYALFGRDPLGYHVHSALWYVALVVVVGRLHVRLLASASARLATLIFAVSAAHVMPWAWISARHLAVAATLASLGLLCHLRFREDGWRWGALLSPPLLLSALLAGESGIGGVIFVVAYELVCRRPHWLRSVLPAGAVLALYMIVYVAVDAGARNGSGYVDPLGNPPLFLRLAAERFPMLLAGALLGAPVELALTMGWTTPLAIVGIGITLLIGLALRSAWPALAAADRKHLPWLLCAALVTITPMLGGFPGSRQLILPNLALSALLTVLIRFGLGRRGFGTRALGGALLFVHVLFSPLIALANVRAIAQMARQVETIAATADVSGPKDRPLFVIASDPMVWLYVRAILLADRPPASCWVQLSAAKGTHLIRRTAPDTIELEVEGSNFIRGLFETIYRSEKFPFKAGDTVEQCGAGIRVLETREAKPSRVAVRFDAPVDAEAIRILVWREGRLQRLRLAGSGVTRVAWSAGPMLSL